MFNLSRHFNKNYQIPRNRYRGRSLSMKYMTVEINGCHPLLQLALKTGPRNIGFFKNLLRDQKG